MIQPHKWHKWQVVSIGFICAVKYNHITKSLIVLLRLTITPEQSLKMVVPINKELEEKLDLFLASPSGDGSLFLHHRR